MSEQEKDTISTENLDDVMRKYDKESNIRVWTGWAEKVVSVLLALFSVYCIYMTLVSTALPEIRLSLFLCFITLAGYLVFPARRKHVRPNYMPWFDIVLAFVGGGCFLYHAMDAMRIIKMMGRIGPWQIAAGVVGLVCLAELCRRCVGVPILVVAGLLLGYTFYNKLSYGMPFAIALRDIVNTLFYSPSGVIGTPVNVCFTYIVLFIIFGAFLERTGIAGFFIAFANRIAGRSSGGPAKVAVISSALCGMVSGSSVGNTVTTGAITIPMMKKTGYKPEFAGAVEAAASTGGQIMPPIMGAAAFLMAEYMGLPYAQVALKAIIPALLYFTGIFIAVHLEAKALNLKGISALELPKWGFLLRNCYLILPLVLLIWLVSTGTRTMAFSAAISIIAAFVVGFINHLFTEYAAHKDEKFAQTAKRSVVDSGMNAFDALVAGSKGAITVAVACAVAGVIAGCITTTGLASILINTIVRLAGNATVIGLILTMLCCIVLGMGVPTTANYCIMASTCAPILRHRGGHHAACRPGGLRRLRHREGQSDEDRPERDKTRHRGVHRAIHLLLQSRPAAGEHDGKRMVRFHADDAHRRVRHAWTIRRRRRAQRPFVQTRQSLHPDSFRGRRPADDRARPENGRHRLRHCRRHGRRPADGRQERGLEA